MNRCAAGLAVIIATTVTQFSQGADVGAPLYLNTIGKSGSVEVYYEKYKRDIEQQGSDGNLYLGEQQEDRVIARLNYHASTRASLYVEAGATDSDGSDGSAALVGGGLKLSLHDSQAFGVSLFAAITYVPEIEYKRDGFIDYANQLEYPSSLQTESYYEFSGGLILSKTFQMDEKSIITPYAGVMLSRLDGDEDYEFTYPASGRNIRTTGTLEDEDPFSAFAGLSLVMNSTFGIRVEGRFVNQTSVSAGLSLFF
ncbi:MAG TPA: hypothetical protein PKE26_15715 [Kiritimatiellia bacterium]|nr:hypothetical protein [Saprospiraceae bacterium]HMP00543.1 hypothetical protein [Kiritimatiellia bacterium]